MPQAGSLNHVTAFISTIGEDLATGGKVEEEVGRVLDALMVAIRIGATAELAAIVSPWLDRKLTVAAKDHGINRNA